MLIQKLKSFTDSKKTKDFIIYSFGQFINILSPLLVTPYLIYVCGIDKLGIIAIGQSLAYILIVVVDYSSFINGVKEVSINRDNPNKIKELFTTFYFTKFILFFLVFTLVVFLVVFVPFFSENTVAILYSTTIILGQLFNPTWFLQGLENFKAITVINIASKIVYILGVFIFIKSQNDFVYANFWLGFGSVFASLIGLIFIIKKQQITLQQFAIKNVKKLLIKDFTFCVSQLFFAIRNYSTVMIIGFFAGDFFAGQFKVIEQIINLFRTYLQMFFKFSYSYVCFEVDKNIEKGIQLWKKLNGYNFILNFVLLTTVYVFSQDVLTFFKVDKEIINSLEVYLQIALLIPLFTAITLPLEQLIFSLNKNSIYVKLTIFTAIINIFTISILIKYFGLFQVFFLLIVTELFLITIYLTILKKVLIKQKV